MSMTPEQIDLNEVTMLRRSESVSAASKGRLARAFDFGGEYGSDDAQCSAVIAALVDEFGEMSTRQCVAYWNVLQMDRTAIGVDYAKRDRHEEALAIVLERRSIPHEPGRLTIESAEQIDDALIGVVAGAGITRYGVQS